MSHGLKEANSNEDKKAYGSPQSMWVTRLICNHSFAARDRRRASMKRMAYEPLGRMTLGMPGDTQPWAKFGPSKRIIGNHAFGLRTSY